MNEEEYENLWLKKNKTGKDLVKLLLGSVDRETWFEINEKNSKILYDYIIQLQHENQQFKEQLIKYLENFISKTDYEVNVLGNYPYLAWSNAYKKILEMVKSDNYE